MGEPDRQKRCFPRKGSLGEKSADKHPRLPEHHQKGDGDKTGRGLRAFLHARNGNKISDRIFHTEGQSEPDDRHLGCGASQARLSPAECTRAFARDACRRHGQDGATARGRAFLGSLLRLGNDTDRGGYADDKYGTGTEKRLCRGGISFHRQGDMGEREKRSARGDKYGDNL